MFCVKCGTVLPDDALYCSKCGYSISNVASAHETPRQARAIWNPDAAANWSLVFSPIFGSYLHALNWRTLGEPDKERSAMGWFYFSILMLVVVVIIASFTKAARGVAFVYLFVWYFAAGRSQVNYVREKFGTSYARRGWGGPLLIAVLIMIAVLVVSFMFIACSELMLVTSGGTSG